MSTSSLNRTIPPEIKNDDFYAAILRISLRATVKTVLEIGSSAGGGSTEALVSGLAQNPNKPRLFCIEVSSHRFAKLSDRYRSFDFVRCYNVSSVPPESFATPEDVTQFYRTVKSHLNSYYSLEKVLGWLQQDLDYLAASGVSHEGIQRVKSDHGIDVFDMVLIDGSEFSGVSELKAVYGSKLLLLDDVNSLKNYHNYCLLSHDPNYEILLENKTLRNGFAIFKKVDFSFSLGVNEPISVPLIWKISAFVGRIKSKCGRILGGFSTR